MVKVVGLTKEEIEERKRRNKLEQITKTTFTSEAQITTQFNSWIEIKPNPKIYSSIFVTPDRHRIRIDNPELFSYAQTLAEAYERNGEPEFTIKKTYEE